MKTVAIAFIVITSLTAADRPIIHASWRIISINNFQQKVDECLSAYDRIEAQLNNRELINTTEFIKEVQDLTWALCRGANLLAEIFIDLRDQPKSSADKKIKEGVGVSAPKILALQQSMSFLLENLAIKFPQSAQLQGLKWNCTMTTVWLMLATARCLLTQNKNFGISMNRDALIVGIKGMYSSLSSLIRPLEPASKAKIAPFMRRVHRIFSLREHVERPVLNLHPLIHAFFNSYEREIRFMLRPVEACYGANLLEPEPRQNFATDEIDPIIDMIDAIFDIEEGFEATLKGDRAIAEAPFHLRDDWKFNHALCSEHYSEPYYKFTNISEKIRILAGRKKELSWG